MATERRRLISLRKAQGFTQEDLAEKLGVDRRSVQRWENGSNDPQPWMRPMVAKALDINSRELENLLSSDMAPPRLEIPWTHASPPSHDDEFAAWELSRRAQASDVGSATLDRLETAFAELAIDYPVTSPQTLLARVRKHLAYVSSLLDAKKTLREHERLLVVGGWMSLLAATLHIDLDQQESATACLHTASTMAQETGQSEIYAWCYETEAWRVLTDGDFAHAAELSRMAQEIAPSRSSAAIQATAQEGRARARLGETKQTFAAIGRVDKMAESLEMRESPQHHYQYDPAKALSYKTTTLAWLGDPSAEGHAREVIAQLNPSPDITRWPRRVASAKIDLALALLAADRLDEACNAAQQAILSGRVVPSNHWRALEVVAHVERRQLPEATDLREAFEGLKAIEGAVQD